VSDVIKQKTSHYGIAIQLPDNWGDQALIFSAGGELLSEDKQRVNLQSKAASGADVWQDCTRTATPVCTDTEQTANFSAGDIAMLCNHIMKINTFSESAAFDPAVAQLPAFEGLPKQLPAGGAAMISFATEDAKKEPCSSSCSTWPPRWAWRPSPRPATCASTAEVP
jgi:hypothetical protein